LCQLLVIELSSEAFFSGSSPFAQSQICLELHRSISLLITLRGSTFSNNRPSGAEWRVVVPQTVSVVVVFISTFRLTLGGRRSCEIGQLKKPILKSESVSANYSNYLFSLAPFFALSSKRAPKRGTFLAQSGPMIMQPKQNNNQHQAQPRPHQPSLSWQDPLNYTGLQVGLNGASWEPIFCVNILAGFSLPANK